MRLDTVDFRSSQSDVRTTESSETKEALMTPARRAALDALEREFRDLLKLQQR